MSETSIEWTDATWNPVTGCTKVSQGCKHCYAETLSKRWWGERKFTDVRCHPERLAQPLRWRKPRRVFVNSMSDLFHEDVPPEFIGQVWATMRGAPQHVFQILTKRPERMRDWLRDADLVMGESLPNVWLGVSVEDQANAEERIQLLLETPAAVRFLSCEPLLAPVDLGQWLPWAGYPDDHGNDGYYLDWVIVGGESGHGARAMDLAWARSIVAQCRDGGVPCFVKQLGHWPYTVEPVTGEQLPIGVRHGKGGDPDEWPPDLRVREWPAPAGGDGV